MKRIILLFFIVSISLVSFGAKERYYEATLYLKDSTIKKGLIPFLESKSVEHVFFKINEEADVINIESIKIDKIVYVFDGKSYEYEYIKVYRGIKQDKISSEAYWIECIKKGIVSLYHVESELSAGVDSRGMERGSATFHDYYVKKENEAAAKLISTVSTFNNNGVFRKYAPIYFFDYVELAEKIKNKEYKWKDIERVIDIYNDWVSKKGDL